MAEDKKPSLSNKQLAAGFGGKDKKMEGSLDALTDEMKKQTQTLNNQIDANTLESTINKLEGFLGVNANETTQQLKSSFETINADLMRAIETGDEKAEALAQAQLEALGRSVESEEKRRESQKILDEQNDRLLQIASGIDGLGNKFDSIASGALKGGGILAGLGALFLAITDPEKLAKILGRIIEGISNTFRGIIQIFQGDFAGGIETLGKDMGAVAGIIGGLALMFGGKIIGMFGKLFTMGSKLVKAFQIFGAFMRGQFVMNMLGYLKGMMQAVGGAFMKGFQLLLKGFQAFRLFMVGTMIPTLVAGFTSMMAAMVPIIVTMAVPLAIIGAIALAFFALKVGLEKIRDALGFTSVFDVLLLGFAYLSDGIAHMVNGITGIINLVIGIAEKIGSFIPGLGDLELPKIPKMATDNAAKKRAELDAKAEAKALEEAEKNIEQQDPTVAYDDAYKQQLQDEYKVAPVTEAQGQDDYDWLMQQGKYSNAADSDADHLEQFGIDSAMANQPSSGVSMDNLMNENADLKLESQKAPTVAAQQINNNSRSTNSSENTVINYAPPSMTDNMFSGLTTR